MVEQKQKSEEPESSGNGRKAEGRAGVKTYNISSGSESDHEMLFESPVKTTKKPSGPPKTKKPTTSKPSKPKPKGSPKKVSKKNGFDSDSDDEAPPRKKPSKPAPKKTKKNGFGSDSDEDDFTVSKKPAKVNNIIPL